MSYLDDLKKQMTSWKRSGATEYVFDKDTIPMSERVYSCGRALLKSEWNKVHTRLLPQPIIGALNGFSADDSSDNGEFLHNKIILCSLNPGFAGTECADELVVGSLIEDQFMQNSNASFFWVLPAAKGTAGYKYWRDKLDQNDPGKSLVQNIKRAYVSNGLLRNDNNVDDVFEMISRVFVSLELIPYHSKIKPKMSVIKGCNSVDAMKDFVHTELLPNAAENNHLICFLRSYGKDGWNVTSEEATDPNVVINKSVQNITFSVESDLGRKIYEYWKKLSNNFTKLL